MSMRDSPVLPGPWKLTVFRKMELRSLSDQDGKQSPCQTNMDMKCEQEIHLCCYNAPSFYDWILHKYYACGIIKHILSDKMWSGRICHKLSYLKLTKKFKIKLLYKAKNLSNLSLKIWIFILRLILG